MRTTVNIDDGLLARVEALAERTHRTVGSVIDEALARMLNDSPEDHTSVTLPDFAYRGGLRPGIDLYDREAMGPLLGEADR
jgi:hypothetical protein